MRRKHRKSGPLAALALAAAVLTGVPGSPSGALEFVAAGAPRDLAERRDYVGLFARLSQNGIGAFLPTFQYQEVPVPRSLDHESDFTAPCTSSDPPFRALRGSRVKLVIPAELLYPNPARIGLGAASADPLAQLLKCAGAGKIAAISNYDEAILNGIALADVKRLYAHVKAIAPQLPVLMVHAPIILDKAEFASARKRARYLEQVVAYSEHADIVGFDVYPVPAFAAQLATPLSEGRMAGEAEAVAGYVHWMATALSHKRRLIVLQGFSYADLYEPGFLRATVPAALLARVRPPRQDELEAMVRQARVGGVEMIVWWGQAALKDSSQAPWPAILAISRKYAD